MTATADHPVEARFEPSEFTEFEQADRAAGLMLARLLICLFALLVIGTAAVGYWTSQNEANGTDPYASEAYSPESARSDSLGATP
jgi:hypothetical protein